MINGLEVPERRPENSGGGRRTSPEASVTARLEALDLSMRRGAVQALDHASLTVGAGEIHALLGQNGSGKSTMLGVVAGLLLPDSGGVSVDGEHLELNNPHAALGHGITMVSQELALAPDLTVAENILMGRGMARGRTGLSWEASRAKARETLDRVHLAVDPRTRTGDLTPDQQQLVEIARALSTDSRLLILDEPTSSLSHTEVAALFHVLRSLKQDGVSVVLVSHRLPELFEICDAITVLRDGRTVLESPMAEMTPDTLMSAMVGRAVSASVAKTASTTTAVPADRDAVLTVDDLASGSAFAGVHLAVGKGEILGLAGLAGAGCRQVLESVAGLRPVEHGEIRVDGAVHRPQHMQQSIASGVAYLPPDRQAAGVQLSMSISDNIAICQTYTKARLRRPSRRTEEREAAELAQKLAVRADSVKVHVGTLSGGNQQKVAIGRCLAHNPRLLLLDEPTRGVDVAARAEIHTLLKRLAGDGMAIVVASSETDELLALSDRIAVMYAGGIAGELSGADRTEENIVRMESGH